MNKKKRCDWVGQDPLYIDYHDQEWGRPIYDDRLLFEFLNLEGMQAGLSWLTVLKKRAHYRKVFDRFNANKIVRYDQTKFNQLMNDPGIIRNRLKIQAVIGNAKTYLAIKKEFKYFSDYIWQFVSHQPIENRWKSIEAVPDKTVVSDEMSKDLKRRGFKFVGSTICYAYMQAVGMVNDHTVDCFCWREIADIPMNA